MSIQHDMPPQKLTGQDLIQRRMRVQDIENIMPIESVSFGAYHWSEDGFKAEINNKLARYWVLYAGETLVGYAGYWHIIDEAHVTTIATHPEYRGNSLGEAQLINLIDDATDRSIKFLTLEVRVSNFPAQQLYYKYGFKCEGIRPKYYQDTSEDAMIMTTPNMSSDHFRKIFRENKAKLIEKMGGTLPERL